MIKKDDHPTHPWICDIRGQGVHYHRRFATQNKARAFERQIHGSRQGSYQGTTTASSGAQTFAKATMRSLRRTTASGVRAR